MNNFDTVSYQSRTTISGGSMGMPEDFVLDLPQARFKPLKVGVLSQKTKLEEILEKVHLAQEDYIWYTEIKKVTRYNILIILFRFQESPEMRKITILFSLKIAFTQ